MITRRTLAAAAAALGLLTQIPAVLAAADAKGDPETWVVEISNNILSRIKGAAMPVVDFERMTRMAVGPKWRTATPEQRTELQSLFRAQLTNVYSGALATVKDQTVKLAPNRVKPTETDAIVRTLLVAPGKPDMRINYRLKKVKGEWRIIDVDVEGIWLVDNYRSQFASVVNSSGIDGLIKSLREKVGQSAAK